MKRAINRLLMRCSSHDWEEMYFKGQSDWGAEFLVRRCSFCGKKQVYMRGKKWVDIDGYEWKFDWEKESFEGSTPWSAYHRHSDITVLEWWDYERRKRQRW